MSAGAATWDGGGSTENASEAANWSNDTLPSSADDIVLDATTNKNMTWDAPSNGLPATVKSWTQNAGYSGTVTFMTTYSGTFTNFAVSGDAVIDGGKWMHADNSSDPTYRLCVSIGGNLTVGATGAISGDLCGYDASQGPSESQPRSGGAHGGISGSADLLSKTYGSVRAPYALGSGGYGGKSGGGALRLTVGGAARIDGNITVLGGDHPDHWGPGAGGSILMTASNLTGAGWLRADGGNAGYPGAGGGGRIAVVLSAGDFAAAPTMSALGGTANYEPWNNGAAGTIYREAASDAQGGGTVVVDNSTRIVQDVVWTTLPAMRSDFGTDDLSQTAWVVRNRGKLKVLAHNLVLRALTIEGSVPLLDLGTNVLIVGSLSVAGTTFDTGTSYSAADINARVGSSRVSGAGYVSVGGTPAVETREPTLGAGTADLNGALLSTGLHATAVQVFWGPTSGGTNAASWARTNTWAAPQGAGLFSTNVSPPWGTVYYRFSASNSAGRHWASEEIFSLATVDIAASDALARKYPADAGEFTVSCPESATGTAVTVNYRIAGTASNGVDYTTLPGSVTIPIGSTNAPIAVTPKGLWNAQDKTVRLELLTGNYQIGTDSNATVTLQAVAPPAGTNAWLGGDITQAASWSEGHAPLGTDHILLSGWVAQDMTWGAAQPAAVASWTQTRFYTNTVTLGTTYAGFSAVFTNLAVAGNLDISGGRWTHTGNSTTNAYRVSVSVGGAFTLGTNAVIDVDARGYGAQYGPGSLPWVAAWGGPRDGGAHGGVGGYSGYATNETRTYDSVLAPWMPGSGAGAAGGTGGGAVWLAVTGPATVDGTITANGSGSPDHWGAGAGGGLYLSCASLAGTGTLRANGGDTYFQGAGGGGRIAVVLSAGDFAAAPTMSALGGTGHGQFVQWSRGNHLSRSGIRWAGPRRGNGEQQWHHRLDQHCEHQSAAVQSRL